MKVHICRNIKVLVLLWCLDFKAWLSFQCFISFSCLIRTYSIQKHLIEHIPYYFTLKLCMLTISFLSHYISWHHLFLLYNKVSPHIHMQLLSVSLPFLRKSVSDHNVCFSIFKRHLDTSSNFIANARWSILIFKDQIRFYIKTLSIW